MRKSNKIVKTCENCGKTFEVKESLSNQRFCCRACYLEYNDAHPKHLHTCLTCGKQFKAREEQDKYCSKKCADLGRTTQVEKTCAICGKPFKVIKSRAETAKYCSKECQAIGITNLQTYTCSYCGKEFQRKAHDTRVGNLHFCSKECLLKHKHDIMSGDKNHQYGLKGELNASFKRELLTKKNHNLNDVMIYAPEYANDKTNGRIPMHRLLVQENYNLFNMCFFKKKTIFIFLKIIFRYII